MDGALLHGAARGFMDAERLRMDSERHDSDQAIRGRAAAEAEELAPLRRRATELNLGEAERRAQRQPEVDAQEDELRGLNLNTARMTEAQRREAFEEAKKARAGEQRLKIGLGRFKSTGDPQHVADALMENDPEKTGLTARRLEDGSIELGSPDLKEPVIIKGGKTRDGREYTADEAFGIYGVSMLNPFEQLKQRYAQDLKNEGEMVKQDGQTNRALIRERDRATNAEARAARERARRMGTELRQVSSEVDRGLKTAAVPGHFSSVYANEDDAQLNMVMKKRAAEIYKRSEDDDDMTPQKAAEEAVTEVRTAFLTTKKAALEAAEALRKAKIDPSDKAAVDAAAKTGNKDALRLQKAMKAATIIQPGLDGYLLGQLPKLKK